MAQLHKLFVYCDLAPPHQEEELHTSRTVFYGLPSSAQTGFVILSLCPVSPHSSVPVRGVCRVATVVLGLLHE